MIGSCARCDTTVRKSGSTEEPQGWKRRISVPLERSRAIAENYCLATKDRIDVASSDKSDYLRYGLRRKYVCALLPRRSQSPLIELLCECSTPWLTRSGTIRKIRSQTERKILNTVRVKYRVPSRIYRAPEEPGPRVSEWERFLMGSARDRRNWVLQFARSDNRVSSSLARARTWRRDFKGFVIARRKYLRKSRGGKREHEAELTRSPCFTVENDENDEPGEYEMS